MLFYVSYSLCDVLEHQGILMLFMCPIDSLMFWNTRIDIGVVYVSYSLTDVLEHQGILMLFYMCPIASVMFWNTRVY
jgi:hypothetical protein